MGACAYNSGRSKIPSVRPQEAGAMRTAALCLLIAAGCGTSSESSAAAGNWRTGAAVPGSWVEMELRAVGVQLSGTGTRHVEAGANPPFTVQGTTAPVTFPSPDQSTEPFFVSQPDLDHLTLQSAQQTLQFFRL